MMSLDGLRVAGLIFVLLKLASGLEDKVIQTKYGRILGTKASKHQYFLGIPYAAPPKR